ncbi:peptidase [Tolypothrix bouteillei VB521301]|uniref:Peptidase n=2 Tax=Tolypothrix TaxID=111782 RepID=A0A8S9TEN7_9CYAN|nr:peptidase [Tolypothrix bouteillei VB521301]
MMSGRNNNRYTNRANFILSCCISSSLLVSAYIMPVEAFRTAQQTKPYTIAKLPDEREQEAVGKLVEQVDTPQIPANPTTPKQTIESPLPPKPLQSITPSASEASSAPKPQAQVETTPSTSTATAPAPKPQAQVETTPSTNTATAPAPKPKPQTANTATAPAPKPKPQTANTATAPAPKPKPQTANTATAPAPRPKPQVETISNTRTATAPAQNTIPQQGGRTPSANTPNIPTPNPQLRVERTAAVGSKQPNRQSTENSPINLSNGIAFKEINFVDFALGILAPGDYQYKGRHYHFYQFDGQENQYIQIRLTGSADNRRTNNLALEPFVLLLDPDNNVLVSRGTTQKNKDAYIFARLPVAGRYTIAVTSRDAKDVGRYSLALRNDTSGYLLDEAAKLDESLTLKKNRNSYDVSKFQGKRDQRVSIRVESVYEEFVPYVVLMNSKGQVVASDLDKDRKYSALIDRAKLPEDGTYYVVVISAVPQENGRYRLTMW